MGQDYEVERSGGFQPKKSAGLHLRLPTIITGLFLCLVAIATAYLCGVMSGRHMQAGAVEQPITVTTQKNLAGEADSAVKNRGLECNGQILTAEELEFAKVLKREENGPLARIKPLGEKSQEADSKAQTPPQASAEVPPVSQLRKTLEADTSTSTEDYLFQVGAFRDEKAVDTLREKLEGHGLRTLMARDGKLFLVLVRLRGTTGRAAELVGLFMDLGLGEPILRSRTPAQP